MTDSDNPAPASVGDIESFIDTLRAACDSQLINQSLTEILALSDPDRRELVRNLVSSLQDRNAPRELTQALACLVSDKVAHQALRVIAGK